jgi:enoyl-CoA hydratase/carnithine racemase
MKAVAEAATGEPVVLRRDLDDGIATLTLNRPDKYNALSEALLAALQAELDALDSDESARVVVLQAAGKAFCAGHDLREMRAHPDEAYYQHLFRQCSAVMQGLIRIPQPVIARVHGIATAAGCQLVAQCDLAVASSEARFATSGVNLGLFCSTPGVAVSRNVSRKQAFEMLITGDFIGAEEALQKGLVNRVVPPERLDEAVLELARQIAAKPRVAVATGKRMFYRQLELGLETAYQYASEVMACNMMAPDTAEGIDAFLEKRAPRRHEGR